MRSWMMRISINFKMNLNIGMNGYSRNMTKIVLFLPEKRAGTYKVKGTVSRIKIRDTKIIFNKTLYLLLRNHLFNSKLSATLFGKSKVAILTLKNTKSLKCPF
jgi:hypothetical protein